MIIDHNYARQFQVSFSLFKYKENRLIMSLQRNNPEYVKMFLLAEQLKTLYLINYAFIHKDMREIFDKYYHEELIVVYGKFVYYDHYDKMALAIDFKKNASYSINLEITDWVGWKNK